MNTMRYTRVQMSSENSKQSITEEMEYVSYAILAVTRVGKKSVYFHYSKE